MGNQSSRTLDFSKPVKSFFTYRIGIIDVSHTIAVSAQAIETLEILI